jgi:hypothetical protein
MVRNTFVSKMRALMFVAVFTLCSWSRFASAADTVIDIMLVYDNTATTWVNSNGGMATFSADVVSRMNQATQNSGITLTFRLVHSMSVNHTTTSSSTNPLTNDLYALQGGVAPFDTVAAARNTYGADVVAMMVDHGSAYGYVGQGFMLSRWSGDPNYAYTVNAIQAVAISHTLTHEVGHNLGAHHSKYQISDPGPNTSLDNQYSAGWYFTGTDGVKYHTIMGYNLDGYGNRYYPAPMFSTPLLTYMGTPAGNGTNGDNARLIRQTMDTVASYRVIPALPSAPSIGTAVAGNGGISVSFTPGSIGTGSWVNYRAACTKDGTTFVYGSGSASPVLVSPLTNGLTYACYAQAQSTLGYGPWSTFSNSVVVGTAGVPTSVSATAQPGGIRVSFVAPTAVGAGITGYTATCSAAGQTTRTSTGSTSPIAVRDLTIGVPYSCSVTSNTSYGSSAASAAASATVTVRAIDLTPILMLLLD